MNDQHPKPEAPTRGPYRVSEVAKLIGATRYTVYRLIGAGHIDAYQLTPGAPNSPWLVTHDAVEKYRQQGLNHEQ